MANKIQLRRGTFANLPTLSVGEPAFCTDTKQLFIGDGTNNIDLSATHISDRYSASKTYALGEYCIYNNLLFKCTTAITVAEAWNATKWTLTKVTNEFSPKPKLLWTNPNPAVAFAAQTLTVADITQYDAVKIIYYAATSSTNIFCREIPVETGGTFYGQIEWNIFNNTNPQVRFITGNKNSINVDTGYGASPGDTISLIPLKIYGIKY